MLKVGDRVSRKSLKGDLPREGTVVEAYTDTPDHHGRCTPLYRVMWDDTQYVEGGYMEIGLTKIGETELRTAEVNSTNPVRATRLLGI